MPHPDILRVLNMTPQDWGKLPFHDDTRSRLREKAIAILKGDDVPVDASNKHIVVEQAIVEAERASHLTKAGFDDAMIQQAKFYNEAIEMLRGEMAKLRESMQIMKDWQAEIVNQIRVMEDSRADYTKLIEDRCTDMRKQISALTSTN
jgi:uncharacterized coiled-coil DUF342 family protein